MIKNVVIYISRKGEIMKIKLSLSLMVAFCLFISSAALSAEEFNKGTQIITPVIGLNEFTIPFGANFEYGITDNISIGGTGMVWLWSSDFWSNTVISLSLDGAYHFTQVKVEKLDLFAGAGLGFSIYSFSWKDDFNGLLDGGSGSSGLYLEPFVGARYYVSPKIGLYSRIYFDLIGDWSGFGAIIGASIRLK